MVEDSLIATFYLNVVKAGCFLPLIIIASLAGFSLQPGLVLHNFALIHFFVVIKA